MTNNYHQKTAEEIIREFGSHEDGLRESEAKSRLAEYGPNKFKDAHVCGYPMIFLRQFRSPLIYVLIAAGALVAFMGEIIDALIIAAVLLFNAIVGTIQEGKAERTLLALRRMTATKATVLRDGREIIIPDEAVVPGDIISLNEGDRVPADARLISSNTLRADEASLTGESESAGKDAAALPAETPLADRKNMVWKGTHIVSGNGRAIVVATGINTQIGKIAERVAAIDAEIPLKRDIKNLSRLIIIAVAIIGAAFFGYGVLSGRPAAQMFATVVTLAVSIVPEGLPIVLTLVLAGGVWRLSRRNVLVKKLQAVEALGQARVIAVDKTGTLTKNEMTVQKVYVDGKFFDVGGAGYEPGGDIWLGENAIDPLNHGELILLGKTAAFSANARAVFKEDVGRWEVIGDPTEAALRVFAEKVGFKKDELEEESPKIGEIPFSYKTKYHATMHQIDGRSMLTVIGAPEVVLRFSEKIWENGSEREMSAGDRDRLENCLTGLFQEGLRVLAVSIGYDGAGILTSEKISRLTFLGFVGMKDALRPEVGEAVAGAVAAGMRVIMITGDHKITAAAIGREAGIYREGDEILTGEDLDALSEEDLSRRLGKISIFARVTPEHKLKIINAYKKRGEIIAMTGDGVNDAPSLVAADLGVAMGKIGTEVAKEAADIILTDDNFGTITIAVEEGRHIYKTIKKVILYLFSTSLGEVFIIGGAIVLGWPLPILPAQIIWLNFVTDGFLDVALAMEPKEAGLLRGNFERPKKYLLDKFTIKRMVFMAMVMTIGSLALFYFVSGEDALRTWTISLTVLAVFQWFNAWNCRSEDKSIFTMNPFSNRFLVVATMVVISLQLLAVYNPWLNKILRTAPISWRDWLIIIAVAASIIAAEEIRKFFHRRAKAKEYEYARVNL